MYTLSDSKRPTGKPRLTTPPSSLPTFGQGGGGETGNQEGEQQSGHGLGIGFFPPSPLRGVQVRAHEPTCTHMKEANQRKDDGYRVTRSTEHSWVFRYRHCDEAR